MSHNPFASAEKETKEIQSSVRQGGVPASALYEGTIKAAYLIANPYTPTDVDLAVHIELPSGYEHKIQKTVLKAGSPMITDTKTNKKVLLFSYITMSHIVGAAIEGKTLSDLFEDIKIKKIELYDYESRKNILTDVRMIEPLVGKKLLIGLQRKIANKNQKIGEGKDATWEPLPERKETLEFGVAGNINDRRSFTEFNDGVSPEDATDLNKWEKLNTGKDWNAYKEVASSTGVPASVAPAATDAIHDFGE